MAMGLKILPDITTDRIDANSLKLLDEWRAHFESIRRDRPDLDEHLAFQAWVVQKVSYMQLQVVDLVEAVRGLQIHRAST